MEGWWLPQEMLDWRIPLDSSQFFRALCKTSGGKFDFLVLYHRHLLVLLAINRSVVHLHSESDTLLLAIVSNSNQTVKTRQGWFFYYNAYVKTSESRPSQWTGWWFIFDQPCLVLKVDYSLFSPCFHSTETIWQPPPVQKLPLFLATLVRWGAGRSGRWKREYHSSFIYLCIYFLLSLVI